MSPLLASLLILIAIAIIVGLFIHSRKREGIGIFKVTDKDKNDFKDAAKDLAPRTLIARFVGGFGSLFLTAGIYIVIKNPTDWKTAVKAAAVGVPLLAFAISVIKYETTPLAVHLNRALFLVYALFFAGMLWYLPQKDLKPGYLTMLRLLATALLLASVAGIACSFSRARAARWIVVVFQAGIANFWLFIILRSKGPALWGHPIAVGTWAVITFLLVISLFGKQSNAYYAIQIPQQSNEPELSQNQA